MAGARKLDGDCINEDGFQDLFWVGSKYVGYLGGTIDKTFFEKKGGEDFFEK